MNNEVLNEEVVKDEETKMDKVKNFMGKHGKKIAVGAAVTTVVTVAVIILKSKYSDSVTVLLNEVDTDEVLYTLTEEE